MWKVYLLSCPVIPCGCAGGGRIGGCHSGNDLWHHIYTPSQYSPPFKSPHTNSCLSPRCTWWMTRCEEKMLLVIMYNQICSQLFCISPALTLIHVSINLCNVNWLRNWVIDPQNVPRGYSCIVLIEHQRSHCKHMKVYIRLLLLLVISVMKSELCDFCS